MSEELRGQVQELSHFFKEQLVLADKKLLRIGNSCLSVFNDRNFGAHIPRYNELLQSLYMECVLDIAHGAPVLTHHTMGITFLNGKLTRFSVLYGESRALGNIVCAIDLKSRGAINKDLIETPNSLTQEQINASIYLLAFLLAQL